MSSYGMKKRPIDRKIPHKRDTCLIIIASEGEKTEKKYFNIFRKKFRFTRVQVRVIESKGGKSSPEHVFKRLSEFKKEYDLKADDQLWLMVDVDNWTKRKLSEVARECVKKKIKLAISNPCFEIWLYLHHGNVNPDEILECKDFKNKLKEKLGSYNKSKLNIDDFNDKIENAIKRAKKLNNNPKERWPLKLGTHVYKVVEKILKLSDIK